MPSNYFAVCKNNDEISIHKLPVDASVQEELHQKFEAQEESFRNGIDSKTDFTGDWKPDDNEFLTVTIPEQTDLFINAIINNSLAVESLDIENIENSNIKAVFTGRGTNQNNAVILIQQFLPRHILSRKFTFLFSRNTLNKIEGQAITLDVNLVAIIENGELKFKNYASIQRIFDLTEIHREATDEDIDNFASNPCIRVDDKEILKSEVDQTSRKLIHAIVKNKLLENKKATEIKDRAKEIGLEITIENGQVRMPDNRQDIRRLLRFINDDIYQAPLSQKRYVTNSKRPE